MSEGGLTVQRARSAQQRATMKKNKQQSRADNKQVQQGASTSKQESPRSKNKNDHPETANIKQQQ
eukprot:6469374-Amphidinium_carterae.1